MANKDYTQQLDVLVKQGITVSDDYNRLRHKPTINGFTVEKDKKAQELNLLTNEIEGYEEVKLGVANRDSFLLVIGEQGTTSKLKLNELAKGRFRTVEEYDSEFADGDYIFKKIGGIENGTDN